MTTTPAGAATSLALPPLHFVSSPNFSSRGGRKIDLVVIHDCEGGYAGAISWFSQKASDVSAHIVLREDGLEAVQMVDFANKAWHACAFNSRSIGVEMAGLSSKGFAAGEWQAEANIVAYLLHKFGIPCQWAKGGIGPGFCSHFDLGKDGGGHCDPTTDSALWTHFVGQVSSAYRLAPPADWPAQRFMPTPTVRKD